MINNPTFGLRLVANSEVIRMPDKRAYRKSRHKKQHTRLADKCFAKKFPDCTWRVERRGVLTEKL